MTEACPGAPLPHQLEAELVRELRRTFQQLNYSHFRGALRVPQLSLSDSRQFLGRYHTDTRTIEISRELVRDHAWGHVVEVLKHEMAHQFALDVLKLQEAPHGPAFRALCDQLGIDPRARGLPEQPTSHQYESPVIQRVQRLLALAESDNQHEAEAAAKAAARLMLQHNLDRAATDENLVYGFRQLGRITGRVMEWERRIGHILTEHFFVDVIWVPAYRPLEGKRGSIMEVIGTAENLELSSYVYDFLLHTAQRLWEGHQAKWSIRGKRERQSYLAGVMSGFALKLAEQSRASEAAGLVWLPQAKLADYARKRHPRIRTVQHRGLRRGKAFDEGQAAGRNVVLRRGLSRGPSGGSIKRLPAGE